MRVLSLFSNIGVAEAYLSQIGVDVVVANELIERRAELYSKIYPNTQMICGDITFQTVFQEIVEASRKAKVDVIMATPPCQGISRAGKQIKDDARNLLILPVVKIIEELQPRYVFIENVPQFIETYIAVDGKQVLITDYIKDLLEDQYSINAEVIDTKNYSVPQTRQRTILLLTKTGEPREWRLPPCEKNLISLEDAIGDLPSLDPIVKDISRSELLKLFPLYQEKIKAAQKISRWHYPPEHILRQVITMMHTPTGKTAFDNEKYVPMKNDGTVVRGYKSTYRRLRWCDPASTVTMDNRKISSQNNVHPGRYIGKDENGDDLYSDARALTLFELMRVMSLPDNWPLPDDVNVAFVRSIIGEGIPPMFVKKVFERISEV